MYAGVLPAPAPLPRQPRRLLREPQKGGGTQLEGGAHSGGPECWRRGLRGVHMNRISAFAKHLPFIGGRGRNLRSGQCLICNFIFHLQTLVCSLFSDDDDKYKYDISCTHTQAPRALKRLLRKRHMVPPHLDRRKEVTSLGKDGGENNPLMMLPRNPLWKLERGYRYCQRLISSPTDVAFPLFFPK